MILLLTIKFLRVLLKYTFQELAFRQLSSDNELQKPAYLCVSGESLSIKQTVAITEVPKLSTVQSAEYIIKEQLPRYELHI